MILLSNSTEQTLDPGQSATFDTVIMHTGCAECHRANSGAVNLKANNAIYEIKFTGNIGAATAGDDAQLAITVDSSPLLETTMIHPTAAAGDLNNVSCDTALRTCCCAGAETALVTNTGSTQLNLGANPLFFIKRVA